MKRLVLLFVLLGMTGYVQAAPPTIIWSNSAAIYDWTGTLIPSNSSWIVRLYESTDSAINFTDMLPSGDDTYTGNQFTFGSGGLTDGFCKKQISYPTNIVNGDKVYSVIFNSADISTSTRWAVIDDSVATASLPLFQYNPGGATAGDWQVVPEPATVLLFGLGGMGAWLLRRNRKPMDEDADS